MIHLMLLTMPRWTADERVRRDMAEWRILGSPLSDVVARTIARWCGGWFGHVPNLRAFGYGQEFNLADALEECLTIAAASEDSVTALWEYLEDKR